MIDWRIKSGKRNDFSCVGTVVIRCDKKQLWKILTTIGHLEGIHPLCKEHTSTDWSGVGSTDTVVYKSGEKRERTVTKWIPEELICLDVLDLGSNVVSVVEWSVSQNESTNSCSLSITISTPGYEKIPRILWPFYKRVKLQSQYRNYMEGILMGFKSACEKKD